MLPQRLDDLLLREPASPHPVLLLLPGGLSVYNWYSFRGAGQQVQHHRSKQYKEAHQLEAYIIGEFVRKTHAERTKAFVFEVYGDRMRYGSFKFAARVADVCFSHTEDPAYLHRLPCRQLVRAPTGHVNAAEYTNWRFIAAVLRLADIMDFDGERTPEILFGHLGIRSEVSIQEWSKHRSVSAWDIGSGRAAFSAQCSDPVIEKCIRDFIVLVDEEMSAAKTIMAEMHDPSEPDFARRYSIDLPDAVDTKDVRAVEGPEGPIYEYVDLNFYLDEDGIKSLLLGVSLYADKTLFLRELLQNALDACRHRQALHAADPTLGEYKPEVKVSLLEEDGQEFLEIEDNGMGMDGDIVRFHFAKIGASYYKSSRFLEESARLGIEVRPISQFGIGVLSVFMAADSMEVKTLRFDSAAEPITLEIANEGALFSFRKGDRQRPGTSVRVRLSDPWAELVGKHGLAKTLRSRPASVRSKVRELVPHSRTRIVAGARGDIRRVKNKWECPPLEHSRAWNNYEVVRLNLTKNAPEGLGGVADVVILMDESGLFARDVAIEDTHEDNEGGYDLNDRIQHSFSDGEMQHIYVDYGTKAGLSEGYADEFRCKGRWSQQEIYVSDELINSKSGLGVDFPLPVLYDLNLDGEFRLPLSVDRKSIVPREEVQQILDRIAEELMKLTIGTIGMETFDANRDFFAHMVTGMRQSPATRVVTDLLGNSNVPKVPSP